jgi:uncharacterized phage-like protein YoqJ
MIVAFTGHRPEKLGDNERNASEAVRKFLEQERPTKVISGMARGVDMYAYDHAIDLGIPAIAAVPWVGHGSKWPKVHQDEYMATLERAHEVHVVCDVDDYRPWVYQKRDEWMVDNCEMLVAVWNGEKGSGTYNTIKYAERIGRVIRYLEWR